MKTRKENRRKGERREKRRGEETRGGEVEQGVQGNAKVYDTLSQKINKNKEESK